MCHSLASTTPFGFFEYFPQQAFTCPETSGLRFPCDNGQILTIQSSSCGLTGPSHVVVFDNWTRLLLIVLDNRSLICLAGRDGMLLLGSRDLVTIHFLSFVFFLISVVQHPYIHFAPLHEETDHYLLTFGPSSNFLFVPL